MNKPFEVSQPYWGPHGLPPPPPPPRPRHTAHPYQGARTKRAFATQRQLDIDGAIRTFPLTHTNFMPEEDLLSKYARELLRMFPSRPPEPLGPGIAPLVMCEKPIEDDQFTIINRIKTAHRQRVAEWRLHPKRKLVPKKKCGGPQVPRRVAGADAMDVDAMDVDGDDAAIRRPSSSSRAARQSRPCTPTTPRPVPEDDEDEDGAQELIAEEFERQYHATLEKTQQMQF